MQIELGAADGGYIVYAGWSPVGYGYMVQVDHGNGFSTLYAHMSQWYVDPGQSVARGQIIGAVQASLDISERKQSEEQRKLLVNELNHRVKNTLAVVQSIATQTLLATTLIAARNLKSAR